jgi:mycothiol synthase
LNTEQTYPQLQMIWPAKRVQAKPRITVPVGYTLRTYRSGDETQFFALMALAGWPGWDEQKLKPWLFRILPDGWFMAIEQDSGKIVASAMATHDHTWKYPFCGEVGWVAADPAHTGKGLGLAVTAAVTTRFIEIGYRDIHLFTEHWRLAAIKIYLKLGYEPIIDAPEVENLWQKIFRQLSWPPSAEDQK